MDVRKAFIRVKKEGDNEFELVYPITVADYVMLKVINQCLHKLMK